MLHCAMSTAIPLPKSLRPDLIRRIESMPDDELRLVHSVLLHAEKHRLWAEISDAAEEEHRSGIYEDLPKIIEQVRKEMRQS